MRRIILSKALTHLLAWSIGLIWIVPFIGIIMAAIRPMREIVHGWWRFCEFTPTLRNFIEAWNHPGAPLSVGMGNSMLVAIPATIMPIFAGAIAAYGLVRFKIPLKRWLMIAIVAMMALPLQMLVMPIFGIMGGVGLLNTHLGLIIIHSSVGLPWILFFLRNYFTTLPIEIEESARVDGASDFTVFFRIVLPMCIPAFISAAVLQFMWVWNDFFLALIFLFSPDKLVATQRIPLMRGVFHVDWGVLSAAAIFTMLVPVIIFAFLQRYYVKGMIGWTPK